MNEHQKLYLAQARSYFVVFELLRKHAELPSCHPLHYLQMATEKFGKAIASKQAVPKKTHKGLVDLLKNLKTNRGAQKQMGYQKNAAWAGVIRGSLGLATAIEHLAPTLAGNGPNPEYPWPPDDPKIAPIEYDFSIWRELQTTKGHHFLSLLGKLFASAEAFL